MFSFMYSDCQKRLEVGSRIAIFEEAQKGGKDNNERAYTAGAPSGTRTGAAEFQEEVLLASSLADATRHMSKLNRLLVIVSCSKLFFLLREKKE